MSEERDHDPAGWVRIGAATVKGEAPRFVPWVYFLPMVAVALGVGLAGPYDGWWALVAAVIAAAIAYAAVTVVVLATGVAVAAVSGWRHNREFKRDPRAFFENRDGRHFPPDSPPDGPLGPSR